GKSFDVCPVCGLRPQGSLQKSKDRGICDICSENRQNRSNIWMGKLEETIWIDEVADDKGLVALIVGQFSLLDWLDGKFLSTIPVIDIKDGTLIERENNQDITHQFSVNEINEEFYQGLAINGQFKDFV